MLRYVAATRSSPSPPSSPSPSPSSYHYHHHHHNHHDHHHLRDPAATRCTRSMTEPAARAAAVGVCASFQTLCKKCKYRNIIFGSKLVLKIVGQSSFSPCQCRLPSPRKADGWKEICRKTNGQLGFVWCLNKYDEKTLTLPSSTTPRGSGTKPPED